MLAYVFPDAGVPVVQLSINAGESAQYYFDLSAKLAPLRDRGIFTMGSGNVVHNLRLMDRVLGDTAFNWGERFDSEVKLTMVSAPSQLSSVVRHPDYALSFPTPGHFTPLLYLAGLSSQTDKAPTESFWGRLKVGRLYGHRFATRRQAMDEVID